MNALAVSPPPARLRLAALALAITAAAAACQGSVNPKIRIVSGDYQSTPYASKFAHPLTVEVFDERTSAGLPGYSVTFTAGAGIGLSATSATTDANGQASVKATGKAAGAYSLTAQIAGRAIPIATFKGLGVSKVPLSVTAADETALVGVVPSPNSYSISGFVNGESAVSANISGTPVLTTRANNGSRAGEYPISVETGSLSAANYSFVPVRGMMNVIGLEPCGMVGASSGSLLGGTYAFHLYNEQGGFTGEFTVDGVSRIYGQSQSNQSDAAAPSQNTYYGIYGADSNKRGAITLLQSEQGNPEQAQVARLCMVVDNIVNGVATSGRLVSSDPAGLSMAGSFYLNDGSVRSPASLEGTYVLSMQGTGADGSSGKLLRSIAVAEVNLDGNGNVTGGMADVEEMRVVSGNTVVSDRTKLSVTGNYFFNPIQGSGVLSLAYDNHQINLAFVAPSSQQLLVMTIDDASTVPTGTTSTEPIYFGEAKLRAAGAITAATLSGNFNMQMQGIDPRYNEEDGQEGLVAAAGGYLFNGAGALTPQGTYNTLDGNPGGAGIMPGAVTYTVDPNTGRFEALDPTTQNCVVCGYIVGPGEVDTVITQNGLPLFASFAFAAASPKTTSLGDLKGGYSVASTALISPQETAWEGVVHFDGKGNFQWMGDNDGATAGPVFRFNYKGTYTAANGTYSLTVAGSDQPDFYIYLDANGHATLIPSHTASKLGLPMMVLNAIQPATN